jgi:riboflavin kinase/FMN adenylyltransferase
VHVARGLEDLPRSAVPVFVCVGVFDGLHLGHAYLLHHLVAEAAARSARPVVITFDHHPDEILTGNAPPLLCDPDERLARLAAAGVDTTVVVHFDRRLRETPYQAFVAAIAGRAPIAGFLMTPDAAFGYERAGTPQTLAALGRVDGFDVVVVPPFEVDGAAVRSSEIRAAIAAGDLDRVATLLGRPHAVVGDAIPEVTGDGEATVVRFPVPVALPPDGRYAGEVAPAGRPGVASDVEVRGDAVILRGGLGRTSVRVAFRAAFDPDERGM